MFGWSPRPKVARRCSKRAQKVVVTPESDKQSDLVGGDYDSASAGGGYGSKGGASLEAGGWLEFFQWQAKVVEAAVALE